MDIENRHFRDKNVNLVKQSALDKKETMKQHALDKNASKYKKKQMKDNLILAEYLECRSN